MDVKIKIDRDIPIATIPAKRCVYPLMDMKIMDSFFVPKRKPVETWPLVSRHAKKLGIHLKMRSVVERGVGGTRVWRVG